MSAAKRGKAATAANGHTIQQRPVQAISIAQGHGLSELAAQLAELEDLFVTTDTARQVAEKECKPCEPGAFTPEAVNASRAAVLLYSVNRKAHGLTDTLQDLILQIEPRTLDESLALLLVYNQQMELYLDRLRALFTIGDDLEEFEGKLERAREAIVRGLVHGAGATSPLLRKYAPAVGDLVVWDDLRREAEETAARYPRQKAEAVQ
jgi:hypothetical protein